MNFSDAISASIYYKTISQSLLTSSYYLAQIYDIIHYSLFIYIHVFVRENFAFDARGR